ncbi:hypothetical protein QA089_001594 [Meyerozyma guilliermondii]
MSEQHTHYDFEIKEQDRFLPIANVARVMKSALPPHAKLSKESKTCIQECVSEFISFITSQASDNVLHEKRKSINGEDVLWAMYTLGFESYAEILKIYLAKYRHHEQLEASKRTPRRRKRAQEEDAESFEGTGSDSEFSQSYSPSMEPGYFEYPERMDEVLGQFM